MLKKRYYELDALRGMAAVFVMFFHYSKDNQNICFFNLGVTAVDLFFIISGFVIFMSINNISTGKDFVISRISRLYPTYWACVTFAFSVMVFLKLIHFKMNHVREIGIIDYLANMTMFQYYLGIPNLDGPYWTLTIEMLFYIVILLLFQLRLLRYITEIGCIIMAAILFNHLLIESGSAIDYTIYFPLLNHFPLFFAGITFYKIANNIQNKLTGYLIIGVCLLVQIKLFRSAGLASDSISISEYIGMLVLYFSIFILFINNKLKVIVSKPTIFLGKISFALYLVHSYFFRGLLGYLIKHLHINFWIATFCIIIPLVILTSALITNYIEKPYGKILKESLYRFKLSFGIPMVLKHPTKNI